MTTDAEVQQESTLLILSPLIGETELAANSLQKESITIALQLQRSGDQAELRAAKVGNYDL